MTQACHDYTSRYHTPVKTRLSYLPNTVQRCAAESLPLQQTDEVNTVHDPDFRQSEKDWFSFVEKLTERLVEIDDTVPELPVKDIVSCPLHRSRKTMFDGASLTTKRHRSSASIGMSASPKIPPRTRCALPALLASQSARGVAVTASPRPSHHRPMPA